MSDQVGFTSPADPPGQPPQKDEAAKPRPPRKPILRLVQKFFSLPSEQPGPAAPMAPAAPVAPIAPVAAAPMAPAAPEPAQPPPPPPPPQLIRIEATKEPDVWLFSTIPSPIGIEGMVRAPSRPEAVQAISQAIRGLSIRTRSEGMISLALLVDPTALVGATRMTPDMDGEREVCNAKIV